MSMLKSSGIGRLLGKSFVQREAAMLVKDYANRVYAIENVQMPFTINVTLAA